MTRLDTIRAAIVARLNAVPGIGRVHDHEPYTAQQAELRQLYTVPRPDGPARLLGWHVRRLATGSSAPRVGRSRVEHRWVIRGFRALDESAGSELAFDTLIEAVRQAFDADETLGGAVVTCTPAGPNGPSGLQLEASEPVMFAGVLCHRAMFSLITVHWE